MKPPIRLIAPISSHARFASFQPSSRSFFLRPASLPTPLPLFRSRPFATSPRRPFSSPPPPPPRLEADPPPTDPVSILPSVRPHILFLLTISTTSILLASYLTSTATPATSSRTPPTRTSVPRTELDRLRFILRKRWDEQRDAQKVAVGLIGIMGGVYLAWKIPIASVRSSMAQFFWHNPLNGRTVTLLTCVFSHRTLAHLAFNSLALYSFAPSVFAYLDMRVPSKDSPRSASFTLDSLSARWGTVKWRPPSAYEFVAFFVTAGVFSSLVSHIYSIRHLLLKQLRTLPPIRLSIPTKSFYPSTTPSSTSLPSLEAATLVQAVGRSIPILPSLGASGAVYSMLTLTALSFPSASVSLIFLPWIPIPIGTATSVLVLVDLVGLLSKWRMFDHAAHLGGAVFGLVYWIVGHEGFELLRTVLWG